VAVLRRGSSEVIIADDTEKNNDEVISIIAINIKSGVLEILLFICPCQYGGSS